MAAFLARPIASGGYTPRDLREQLWKHLTNLPSPDKEVSQWAAKFLILHSGPRHATEAAARLLEGLVAKTDENLKRESEKIAMVEKEERGIEPEVLASLEEVGVHCPEIVYLNSWELLKCLQASKLPRPGSVLEPSDKDTDENDFKVCWEWFESKERFASVSLAEGGILIVTPSKHVLFDEVGRESVQQAAQIVNDVMAA
jgi:hypothetical protein